MNMAINRMIVSGLLLAIATLSTVSAQCCDFSPSSNCSWEINQWEQGPTTLPATDPYYPGFYPTPDMYYKWIQEKSGTMFSTTSFSVTSPASGFSLDYYLSTSDPLIGNYMTVGFINSVTRTNTDIANIVSPNYGWLHYTLICDSNVNYCCGSLEDIPCTGTIEIDAVMHETYNQALFGIANFCGETTMTTVQSTTAVPTTLPPPVPDPDLCCTFDNNICAFYSYPERYIPSWLWSKQSLPPFSPPPFDGSDGLFMWSNSKGATLQVDIPQVITSDTYFSVEYYADHIKAFISVTFLELGHPDHIILLSGLEYSNGQWQRELVRCTNWCTTEPCSGTISFENMGNTGFIVAIDNASIDGHCHDGLPCCYFDDPYFCGLVPVPHPALYAWQWSGSRHPDFIVPPPTSGSRFIYFETNSHTGSAYTATLQSQMFEISNQAKFTGSFYVYTPAGSDALQLNFREMHTGNVTSMDLVKDTGSAWNSLNFFCNSINGDCCQGYAPSCEGYLELTAFVETDGGTVFYGIDALQIDDKCVLFPA